jgi:hypothetical protein
VLYKSQFDSYLNIRYFCLPLISLVLCPNIFLRISFLLQSCYFCKITNHTFCVLQNKFCKINTAHDTASWLKWQCFWLTCIQKLCSSNLGWSIKYAGGLHVYFSPSTQMMEYYPQLEYNCLYVLYNSLFTIHSALGAIQSMDSMNK